MTSPGGWFGGFLDDQVGKAPSPSPGSSLPRAPSNRTAPSYPGSADSYDRQFNPNKQPPPKTSAAGSILYSGLDLPPEWQDTPFTAGINTSPVSDYYGNPATHTEVVRMTVANGLEWLRNLSVTDKEGYNSWVLKLYDAGYLSESELKFGAYTSVVAQAFAEAAYDTALVNQSMGTGGSVVSLGDNLQALADGAQQAGMGGAPRVPRIDQQLDDDTLKDNIRTTARGLLGRSLSDDEEASLVSRFRSVESQWNDSAYNADVARATGGTATETTAPNPDVIAREGIDDTLGTERAAQMLGGYAGVLRNMVGLGGASSIGGTLA